MRNNSKRNACVASLLIAMAAAMPNTIFAERNTATYSYIGSDAELQLNSSVGRVTYYAYIALPAAYTEIYNGCDITAIDIAIGSCRKAPNTNFKINITDNYLQNTDFIYQQDAEVTPGTVNQPRWNKISLTTPYHIEAGKPIYIGYQLDASSGHAPIASATNYPAKTGTNDMVGYYVSDGNYSMESTGFANAIILTVEGENLPAHELDLVRVKAPRYGYKGYDTHIECLVRNCGYAPINGIDYTYALRYNAQDHDPVNATHQATIQPGEFANIGFDIPVDDDAKGTITLSITTNPSGDTDAYTQNNQTKTTFTIAADCVPRTTLIEGILSTSDASTELQYGRVAQILRLIGEENAVVVNHYQDQGSLLSDMIADFNMFYAYGGIQFPSVQIDRTIAYDDYPIIPFYPYAETPGLAKDIHEITTPVVVSLSNPVYDSANSRLSIDLDAKSLKSLAAPVFANVVITEDSVVGRQYGSADINNFTHRHVYRAAAVANVQGDPISLDQPLHKTYTIDIPTHCNTANLTAVAYINYHDATALDNCMVLNATSMDLDLDYTGIIDVNTDSQNLKIMGGSISNGSMMQVYSADGRLVARGRNVSLAPGLYIITDGTQTHKILVK